MNTDTDEAQAGNGKNNFNPGEEWEGICRRCGQCCFEKWVEGDGTVHPTPIPCRYLDIVTRRCKVYHKRLDVDEGCIKLTPEIVREVNWLPEDCAYVERIKKSVERMPSRRKRRQG